MFFPAKSLRFIHKIAWEGGPLSAVEYGLSGSDADEPRLGELWQAIADHSVRGRDAGGTLDELTEELYRYVGSISGGPRGHSHEGRRTTVRLPACYNCWVQMYEELAGWWPLLSAPEEYADEAAMFNRLLAAADSPPQGSLLDLGCGGGNVASFLKATWATTLTDVSPHMLAVSRALNPECSACRGRRADAAPQPVVRCRVCA